MQKIETYPNIMKAYLTMESCNGGLFRGRSQEEACRETDPIIGADGVTHDDLVQIDEWLQTLSEDEVLDFVDGDIDELQIKLTTWNNPIANKANGLFEDLFNG